eukprot:SAG31_NODE_41210_length_277_cov_0.584270_1_plen_39_part_10
MVPHETQGCDPCAMCRREIERLRSANLTASQRTAELQVQ